MTDHDAMPEPGPTTEPDPMPRRASGPGAEPNPDAKAGPPDAKAAPPDPEVAAMQAVAGAMGRVEDLDPAPRQRVLAWMVSRWGPFPGPPPAPASAPPSARRVPRWEEARPGARYDEGDELELILSAPGRKDRQAAGYLEDGTLVVVDDAEHLLGSTARIVVERVRPTSRGHMVFARLAGLGNGRRDAPPF